MRVHGTVSTNKPFDVVSFYLFVDYEQNPEFGASDQATDMKCGGRTEIHDNWTVIV